MPRAKFGVHVSVGTRGVQLICDDLFRVGLFIFAHRYFLKRKLYVNFMSLCEAL